MFLCSQSLSKTYISNDEKAFAKGKYSNDEKAFCEINLNYKL